MRTPDEDDDSPDTESQIDAEIFAKFAKAKEINVVCDSCQKRAGWTVYNNGQYPPSLIGTKDRDMLVSPPVIPLVTMRCKNCGFVRLYDRAFIVRWVKEQEDA
jgi:hypothetical protein